MNHPEEIALLLTQHHLEMAAHFALEAGFDPNDGLRVGGCIADALYDLERDPRLAQLHQPPAGRPPLQHRQAANGTSPKIRAGTATMTVDDAVRDPEAFVKGMEETSAIHTELPAHLKPHRQPIWELFENGLVPENGLDSLEYARWKLAGGQVGPGSDTAPLGVPAANAPAKGDPPEVRSALYTRNV
jgi:hypothetical protein